MRDYAAPRGLQNSMMIPFFDDGVGGVVWMTVIIVMMIAVLRVEPICERFHGYLYHMASLMHKSWASCRSSWAKPPMREDRDDAVIGKRSGSKSS